MNRTLRRAVAAEDERDLWPAVADVISQANVSRAYTSPAFWLRCRMADGPAAGTVRVMSTLLVFVVGVVATEAAFRLLRAWWTR